MIRATSRYHPEIVYSYLHQGIPLMDINGDIVDAQLVFDNISPFVRRSYDGVFGYPTYEDAVDFHIPATAPTIHPDGYWEQYEANYWSDSRIWELLDTPEHGLVYAVKQT